MKRVIALFSAAVLLVSLSACGSEETEDTGINVYYVSSEGDGLVYENIEESSEYSEELIQTLIEKIQNPDIDEEDGGESVLKNGITISSYEYDSDSEQINIDLSGDYGSLANSDKLLLTAGLTLTFEQIDNVSNVYITIQGETLLDSNGDEIGSLNDEDFVIHSGNEINIYTSTTMTLYFLDSSGDELVPESRTVYYNSNVQLEQVVLEELIKGPQEFSNQASLSSTLDFLSVTTQEGICYVNFDDNAVQTMTGYDCELALESIVESIDAVCGINQVQFSVNGDMTVEFADGTTIDHIYTAE